jgi:hypothetical protein
VAGEKPYAELCALFFHKKIGSGRGSQEKSQRKNGERTKAVNPT